jgi:endonuclease YncB( thermonuclease family)
MRTHVRTTLLLFLIAAAGLFAFQAQPSNPPKPFTAKVIEVTDGDTIKVEHEGHRYVVRLETIDAPEITQAFGPEAKKALTAKISGKEVKIVWKKDDKYKRILGEVFLGDRRLSLEMVAEGYAWHYVQYSNDPLLANAEKEARDAKKGLWADAKPIPPWEFRAKHEAEVVSDPTKVMVYIATKRPDKYHVKDCQYLAKNGGLEITLAAALKQKYEPCSKCNPPVVAKEPKK